ncbi:AAA family ATPase [Sorangium sp. So ce341]
MTIASFWAKGYRSLRDVRVDDLGPFNIFYGPNGSGKSNLLEP